MPGRCPSCNQVYTDETLSFCPNDGTPLIKDAPSSYDPQATMLAQPPPVYPPQPQQPPQQGYYAPQGGQAPPPQGGQVPPQGWQQPPYGQQQQLPPQYGAPPVGGKSSKLPLIIALAAIVLIGGGIGLYFLLRDNSSTSSKKVDVNVNTTSTSSTPSRTPTSTTTSTFPTPTTSTTNSSTTAGSDYSDDEKHKLFQAVGITKDTALIIEVAEKIGLSDSTGHPTPAMQPFIQEHMNWAMNNRAWVQEHLDPVKAREYVMEHK
jgi:hypothetical protein